jgi:hypothetical protein
MPSPVRNEGESAFEESRGQCRRKLRGLRASEPPLYVTNDFFPYGIFNNFRVAYATGRPFPVSVKLLLQKMSELSPQLVDIIDFHHFAPDEVGEYDGKDYLQNGMFSTIRCIP